MKKSDKVWSIVTSNVTSWVRADVLLTDCLEWRRKPDVVLFQELCRDAEQLKAIEAGLVMRRWQSAMRPAVRTADDGLSAGVGVVSRLSGVLADYPTADIEKKHPGRCVFTMWSGVLAEGILVVSLYAYTGPHAVAKNADLLELLAKEISAIKVPFVVGGDWNMSPEDLSRTGFPTRLKATVVSPAAPTYVAGAAATTLDYFIVADCLRPMVEEVLVHEGSGVKKHRPVELVLAGRVRAERVLTLAKPPLRPAVAPRTCMPDPTRGRRLEDLADFDGEMTAEVAQEMVDERYKACLLYTSPSPRDS